MKKLLILALSLGLVVGVGDLIIPVPDSDVLTTISSADARPRGGSRGFSRPSSRPSKSPSRSYKPSSRPSSKPATRPSTRPGSTSTKPSASTSRKPAPVRKFDSKATGVKKRADSNTIYKKSAAPKSSYTAANGKTVKVDPKSPSVSNVRSSMTSDKYANRGARVENHYHTTYASHYGGYMGSPYYGMHIGGGYSPLFWYCMMDWSMNRRAMWMYNQQNTMDRQLYEKELAENAELKAQIAALEASGTAVNPAYMDKEFKENPDLMYTDEHVTAAYNPQAEKYVPPPEPEGMSAGLKVFLWILGIGVVILAGYLMFVKNWD